MERSFDESQRWGTQEIKLETIESEDCVERTLKEAVDMPPFSALGCVKKESENICDEYERSVDCGNEESGYNNYDTKILEEQLVDNEGKVWHSEDIMLSIAGDEALDCDIKLEQDDIKKESSFDETNDFVEDSKTFMKQFIDEGRVCKSEDDTLTENNVLYHAKRELNENTFTDDNPISEENTYEYQHFYQPIDNLHDKGKKHKCRMCDYSASRKDSLTDHVNKVHLKLKKIPMKNLGCHMCDYSTPHKSILKRHVDTVHLKVKNHHCHMCDYSTSLKGTLKRHLDTVHLKLKNHHCHMCDYSATEKASVHRHIDLVHLKRKKYKCRKCDYTGYFRNKLKLHVDRVHRKVKNHACHMCDYTATQKNNIQKHIAFVHLKVKKHECQMCDYATPLKEALKVHVDAVHLKVKDQKCNICDFTAIRAYNLRQHMEVVHLNVKKFKCEMCSYTASRKQYLNNHIEKNHK